MNAPHAPQLLHHTIKVLFSSYITTIIPMFTINFIMQIISFCWTCYDNLETPCWNNLVLETWRFSL